MGLFLNLSVLAYTSQNLVGLNLVNVLLILGLNHFENLVCFRDFRANFLHSLFLLECRDSNCNCFRADLYDLYFCPMMIHRADFWTRSILSRSSLVRLGCQTATANYRRLLICLMYTSMRSFFSAPSFFSLLRHQSFLLALLTK